MGIRLVNAAFAVLPDARVTPSAALVLLWMAKVARDDDEPPVYFASREATALALGRRVPDEPAPDDPDHADIVREREAAFRRVQEAMTSLTRSGLITRLTAGGRGRTATYELNLTRLRIPSSTTENVALSTTDSVAVARRIPSPLGTQEEHIEEQARGTTSTRARTSRAPVETRGAA